MYVFLAVRFGEHQSLERRSKISLSSCVYVFEKRSNVTYAEISRRTYPLKVTKCTKQCDVRAELLFYFSIKPIKC